MLEQDRGVRTSGPPQRASTPPGICTSFRGPRPSFDSSSTIIDRCPPFTGPRHSHHGSIRGRPGVTVSAPPRQTDTHQPRRRGRSGVSSVRLSADRRGPASLPLPRTLRQAVLEWSRFHRRSVEVSDGLGSLRHPPAPTITLLDMFSPDRFHPGRRYATQYSAHTGIGRGHGTVTLMTTRLSATAGTTQACSCTDTTTSASSPTSVHGSPPRPALRSPMHPARLTSPTSLKDGSPSPGPWRLRGATAVRRHTCHPLDRVLARHGDHSMP